MIVFVNFLQAACYFIWFGTHEEYDKINVETIAFDTKISTNKKTNYELEVLKAEDDYNKASMRMMEIFHADPNSPASDELDLLMALVKDYDEKHYQLPDLDALEVIKYKIQEMG